MKKMASVLLMAGALGGCAMETGESVGSVEGAARSTTPGLLPDLQTVVPRHLNIHNQQQREILRFANGIANTGAGNLQVAPGEPDLASGTQDAIQQLLDADGNVVHEEVVSSYEYHPNHNHWHIEDVAEFSVRVGSPTGPIVGGDSQKVTFCLIDWYALEGNSNTKERTYWDCETGLQGIQTGWVDQYHHSLEGQGLDITGSPVGRYYLVSTANFAGRFLESDYTNNTAWVAFDLTRDSNGNPKVVVVGHSDCSSPGLCGENAPNR